MENYLCPVAILTDGARKSAVRFQSKCGTDGPPAREAFRPVRRRERSARGGGVERWLVSDGLPGGGRPKAEQGPETAPATKPPSRIARQLALAHHVERLVEDGVLRDYAEAARLLGVSRARMTQVMNLLGLSPDLQERLLTGDLGLSERQVRGVLRAVRWEGQGEVLTAENSSN